MITRTLMFAATLLVGAVTLQAQTTSSNSVREELMKINREMIIAEQRGDAKFFERYLADGYFETDGNGNVYTRAKILKELSPTPKQVKSVYDMKEVKVQAAANLAVLTMRSDARTEVSGQKLIGQYRTTQTWMRRNGRWVLLAEHTSRILADPLIAKIDPTVYDSYAGAYDVGEGLKVTVRRHGNRLMIQGSGDKTETELFPENETNFFAKGERGRTIFKKDDSGQVIDCIYRSPDGQEIHAKKIK